jgi:hypothetical protein
VAISHLRFKEKTWETKDIFGLAMIQLTDGLVLLIIAEVLGILEELVDKRGK